jgi:MoxR-like ATPase
VADFNASDLADLAASRGLVYPFQLLEEVIAAIESGKHVMLTGVAGTGKTSLAYLIAELGHRSLRNTGYVAVTASPEWTIGDTIGRYAPSIEGTVFQPGVVLNAVETGEWLVIDEMNRAEFDKSFGPLFTVLAGQAVTLPFKQNGHSYPLSIVPPDVEAPRDTEPVVVPRWWRIIATMNQFDKDTLFRMSYGLMRRFAFVEVGSPADAEIRQLVAGDGGAVAELLCIRQLVDLGAALFVDAAKYMSRRLRDGDVSASRVLFEAFYSYFLPQLDRLDVAQSDELVRLLEPKFDPAERDQIERVVTGVARSGRA